MNGWLTAVTATVMPVEGENGSKQRSTGKTQQVETVVLFAQYRCPAIVTATVRPRLSGPRLSGSSIIRTPN